MAEYQCICCGETQESEKKCTCPSCGYPMYPMPYERTVLLRQEIRGFIDSLLKLKLDAKSISFFRKEKDEESKEKIQTLLQDQSRFPSYTQIYKNAISVNRTEQYFERIQNAITHLDAYIRTPYSQEYGADDSDCLELMKSRADKIAQAVKIIFGTDGVALPETKFAFPKVTLQYREEPDAQLLALASELLILLTKLTEKAEKFVKQNQLFGAFFKKIKMPKPPKVEKQTDAVVLGMALKKQCDKIVDILDKKYFVDILSDGFDEANEMLTALWESIALIQSIPILHREYLFTDVDDTYDSADALLAHWSLLFRQQYSEVSDALAQESFLADVDEKKRFQIYDMLLKADSIGYFGVNADLLMPPGQYEEKLNALVGLDSVKREVRKIKAYTIANKDTGTLNLHMCFLGNPGTGKTEVARLIAGILYENHILPTSNVVETDRRGLVAEYVGQTAEKTMERVQEAMGGVLFIDEAYALCVEGSRGDYGQEAIATLLKAMEDYRGKFCVILTGYQNPMQDMLQSNPGFPSRIQFTLNFPNYSREELEQIAQLMLQERKYTVNEDALEKMLDIADIRRKSENFANAREMRNILEQVILCQNLRTIDPKNRSIVLADVNQYIQDSKISLPTEGTTYLKKILTGEEELEQLIGLRNVKRMVKKIRAYAKRNKQSGELNLHMCFTGNPGTGKTEVARILSRILYEVGALSEAKLVETDASGLIGGYVGETAPKTIAKVRDALGGVLFIDEAYTLAGNQTGSGSYGEEAVAALLKEMEDKRGNVCVILAGYQKEMERLLKTNPGFASRISFTLDFPDYTAEELQEIAKIMLQKKGYFVTKEAFCKCMEIVEYFRSEENFANARTVRNLLEQVILNQNLRAEESGDEEDTEIILSDVEDYLLDEEIDL